MLPSPPTRPRQPNLQACDASPHKFGRKMKNQCSKKINFFPLPPKRTASSVTTNFSHVANPAPSVSTCHPWSKTKPAPPAFLPPFASIRVHSRSTPSPFHLLPFPPSASLSAIDLAPAEALATAKPSSVIDCQPMSANVRPCPENSGLRRATHGSSELHFWAGLLRSRPVKPGQTWSNHPAPALFPIGLALRRFS